jgi:hypothetical protein
MLMGIDITVWIMGAILVVGLTQYIKGLLTFIPAKFKWIYSIISVILSIVVGYFGGGANLVWDCLGILTMSQLGYEFILQAINKKLKGE